MPVKRNSTGQTLPASNPFLKMGGAVPIKNILVSVWYNFPFCKIRGSGQSGVYRLTEKAVTRLEIFTAGVVLAPALEQQRPPPERTCHLPRGPARGLACRGWERARTSAPPGSPGGATQQCLPFPRVALVGSL